VEEDVRRLQVAMDETAVVELREARRDPPGDAGRLGVRQWPLRQPLLERPAVQPLERHERAGLSLAVVVDAHDVLVPECGEGLRLTAEPAEVRGRREDLQRDGAVERRVVRAPDLGHRAVALQLFEPVAPGDFVSWSHDYYGMHPAWLHYSPSRRPSNGCWGALAGFRQRTCRLPRRAGASARRTCVRESTCRRSRARRWTVWP